MKKSALLVVLLFFAISLLAFSGCKKSGKDTRKATETHMKEMMQRSLQEAKKSVAVKVNGEPITMFAILREMNVIGPQYLAQGMKKTPELEQKVRNDALYNVIFRELAVQEAKKQGMQIKPETIEDRLKKVRADAGSEGAFRRYLADNSLTENEMRKDVEQEALFEMIATREVDAKITVTDAALRERYKKEKRALKDANHKQMTFEASKNMIEQKVKEEAAEKRMRAWEKELKKNAKIEIVDKKLNPAETP